MVSRTRKATSPGSGGRPAFDSAETHVARTEAHGHHFADVRSVLYKLWVYVWHLLRLFAFHLALSLQL